MPIFSLNILLFDGNSKPRFSIVMKGLHVPRYRVLNYYSIKIKPKDQDKFSIEKIVFFPIIEPNNKKSRMGHPRGQAMEAPQSVRNHREKRRCGEATLLGFSRING